MTARDGSVPDLPQASLEARLPAGFRVAATRAGIKSSGGLDLAVVVVDGAPAAVAATFTTNRLPAAPVRLDREHLAATDPAGAGRRGWAQAMMSTSGCANAATGEAGLADQRRLAATLAAAVGTDASHVLAMSTGLIGSRLPVERVESAIGTIMAGELRAEDAAFAAIAEALRTTDSRAKAAAVTVDLPGPDGSAVPVTISGVAKGVGMIHPNMATMISILATDATISQPLLQQLLREVTGQTFNRVSVDGDTSVCDMVVAMANGRANAPEILPGTPEVDLFRDALLSLGTHLSRLIAKDGEGATKLVEIVVNGAKSPEDAYRVVLAVGKSPLVKTAIFGEDANWGRILTAIGYSGADFDPAGCDIYLGDLKVCAGGNALLFDEAIAKDILKKDEILIRIELSDGDASDHLWTCDFSYDYVKINGSYRT